MWWTTYNKKTGQLDAHLFDANKPCKEEIPAGADVIEGQHNPDQFFIQQGRITERPTFNVPTEFTVKVGETLTIEKIPEGTRVKYDDGREEITQHSLAWIAEAPGEYELLLEGFPYQPLLVRVEVVEAM